MRKDWEYKKLGEVCEVVSGATPKTNNTDFWGNGYYWITPAEINESTIYVDKTERQITDKALAKTNLRLLPKGTVLLSSRAPIGKVAICGVDMYCNQGFKNCICSDKINNKYLYYFFINKNAYLNSLGRGATFKEISKSIVEKITIPLPPKPTQLAIVAELDKINELIQLKKQQLKDYDQLAQSIFYEMFGDPVENEKGWEVKKLGEMCSAITKGTTPTSIGFNFEKEGVNFVKVEAFGSNDRVDKEKLSFISEECHQNMLRSQLKENDILICIAGATVGKLSIVDFSILPANTNQACAIVRVKDKQVIFYSYLYGYLKYSYIQLVVNNLKKGVAQPNLSLGQIRDFNIKVPPLPLQQQFAARIEAIERQKQQVSETIKDLETLLASRMQYWFD